MQPLESVELPGDLACHPASVASMRDGGHCMHKPGFGCGSVKPGLHGHVFPSIGVASQREFGRHELVSPHFFFSHSFTEVFDGHCTAPSRHSAQWSPSQPDGHAIACDHCMSLPHVSTPLSSVQRCAPGVQESQTPLLQPLGQSLVGPHWPSAPQVCRPSPTHSLAPDVQLAQ